MFQTFKSYPILRFLTTCISGLLVLFTIIPFISIEHWSIRSFDFPHIQLTILTAMLLIVKILYFGERNKWYYLTVTALTACLLYQISKIWPYTQMANYEVESASFDSSAILSIYTSNVLQENREQKLVVDDTERFDADIVLYTETDAQWSSYLNRRLKKKYRHSIEMPLDNTYGMVLYSKFKLEDESVEYMVKDTIPSIHATIILPSKKKIQLYAIHPAPPTPLHNPKSLDRDAELMKIGRLAKGSKYPVVVMGDFNDVAWSETTSLFQSYSGLLDLRKGRGLFNTYHADHWFLRWPLDHVFVSPEIRVIDVQLGENVGSDHFPFYTRLALEPKKTLEQKLPAPTGEVIDDAEEQIEEEKVEDSLQENNK